MKHAKLGNQKAFDLSFGFNKNLVGMELWNHVHSKHVTKFSLLLTDIVTPQLSDSSIRIISVLVLFCFFY